MKYQFLARVIIAFTVFSLGNTLNLEKVADSHSLENSNNTATSNDVPTKQVKGNIGSITNLISNPTQLINSIQSAVNTFLTTLNNTLSSSSSNVTSLLSSLKNITNKASNSSSLRLEGADLVLANISEIVKSSTQAKAELLSNASTEFENQVHGAFEDFRKAVLELKNPMHENSQESSSLSPTLETETGTNTDTSSSTVAPESSSATSEQKISGNREKSGSRSMLSQLSSIHSQVRTILS